MNQVSLFLLIVLALSTACQNTTRSQSEAAPVTTPSPSESASPPEEPEQLIDIFLDEDRLTHHGYEVTRLKKTVIDERPDENGNKRSIPIEISYAVIKRNGKLLAEFEGPYFMAGNHTDFGLFDLLGDRSQQLIISTTIPRGGRHWVVSFVPEFRILFDSAEFDVGRHEFCVIDLDKDGIHEISLPVTAFYAMPDIMYTGETPLPEIIFKYDAKQKKYLPANTLYLDYAMSGLDEELRSLNDEDDRYFSKRLRILLRHIYAGKEAEGWAFFDDAYRRDNKQEMKRRILSVLDDEPLYKYLYKR